MRYQWLDEDSAWVADASPAGPAGSVAVSMGSAQVEFDRIDFGRIARVTVYADGGDAWYEALGRSGTC